MGHHLDHMPATIHNRRADVVRWQHHLRRTNRSQWTSELRPREPISRLFSDYLPVQSGPQPDQEAEMWGRIRLACHEVVTKRRALLAALPEPPIDLEAEPCRLVLFDYRCAWFEGLAPEDLFDECELPSWDLWAGVVRAVEPANSPTGFHEIALAAWVPEWLGRANPYWPDVFGCSFGLEWAENVGCAFEAWD